MVPPNDQRPRGESKSGFDISAFNQSKWLPQIYATFLEPISLVIVIYMSYIWVNYNDLTATSLEIMVSTGNDPQMAQQFRLVKYYHLPRYMYRLNCSWRCPRFPGQILCVLLSDSPSQKLQTMIGPDVCHSHPAITRLAYLQTTPALNSTYRII